MSRFIFVIFLFLLSFLAPWWLFFTFLILGILIFNFFLEGFFLAFLFDFLFGHIDKQNFFQSYAFSLIALLLIFLVMYIKKRLILYN